MGNFLCRLLAAESSRSSSSCCGRQRSDLAMATAGIALALILAVPLSLTVTRSLSVPRLRGGTGADDGAARFAAAGAGGPARVPELVWGAGVRAGLRPWPGRRAGAGDHHGGMLGKVFAEILESGDLRPARALMEAGSGRSVCAPHGLLPGVSRELLSYSTVYRWVCGARLGGDGIRRRRRTGPTHGPVDEDAQRRRGGDHSCHLPGAGAGGRCTLRLAAPALGLVRTMEAFGPRPAFPACSGAGLRGLGMGQFFLAGCPRRTFTGSALADMGRFVAAFFPRTCRRTFSPRSPSAPSRRWPFPRWARCWRLLPGAAGIAGGGAVRPAGASGARLTLNFLRSVPRTGVGHADGAAGRAGAIAGVLALALHTARVLGRLFAEALENPRGARSGAARVGRRRGGGVLLRRDAAGRRAMKRLRTLPLGDEHPHGCHPRLRRRRRPGHHSLLRAVALSRGRASTVILAMLGLSVLVDTVSALLRRERLAVGWSPRQGRLLAVCGQGPTPRVCPPGEPSPTLHTNNARTRVTMRTEHARLSSAPNTGRFPPPLIRSTFTSGSMPNRFEVRSRMVCLQSRCPAGPLVLYGEALELGCR